MFSEVVPSEAGMLSCRCFYLGSFDPLTLNGGWSCGAKVQDKLPVPRRPTIWMMVGQGHIALASGAGWGLFGHFYSPLSFLSSFSLSLGGGPIRTEILSQRAVKPKSTNQPKLHLIPIQSVNK